MSVCDKGSSDGGDSAQAYTLQSLTYLCRRAVTELRTYDGRPRTPEISMLAVKRLACFHPHHLRSIRSPAPGPRTRPVATYLDQSSASADRASGNGRSLSTAGDSKCRNTVQFFSRPHPPRSRGAARGWMPLDRCASDKPRIGAYVRLVSASVCAARSAGRRRSAQAPLQGTSGETTIQQVRIGIIRRFTEVLILTVTLSLSGTLCKSKTPLASVICQACYGPSTCA